MAFLLDTNVISEIRKASPNRQVGAWFRQQSATEAYVSTLAMGEVRQGIELMRPRDPRQAEALERWLDGLLVGYRDRILPVTTEIAQAWGRLNASNRPLPIIDGLMVATAVVHRLTFVTRNVADVARTGVPVLNPFDAE
jgi:predicted nucleic acid-binding protein